MLIAAVSMQAQSILGKWEANMSEGDQQILIYFNFTQSKLDLSIVGHMSDPEVGTISISATIPCTYTHAGDKLTIKPTTSDVKLNVDKIEFTAEIKEVLDQNPELKQQLLDQVTSAMDSSKGDILSELPSDGELTIVSNTGKELILRDETGDDMVLTKI